MLFYFEFDSQVTLREWYRHDPTNPSQPFAFQIITAENLQERDTHTLVIASRMRCNNVARLQISEKCLYRDKWKNIIEGQPNCRRVAGNEMVYKVLYIFEKQNWFPGLKWHFREKDGAMTGMVSCILRLGISFLYSTQSILVLTIDISQLSIFRASDFVAPLV